MYSAEINRNQPACLLLLVDQSTSMQDPWAGTGNSKAHQLALAVNRILGNAVLQCSKGDDRVYDYFEVGIIGYGNEVQPILHGSNETRTMLPISEVAHNPKRVDTVLRKVPDGAGGLVDEPTLAPVWVDPVSHGHTPMVQAVEMAQKLVVNWCDTHPRSFPPLVINLTDGASTDGDPRAAAAALRNASTLDGDALMFNIHFSGGPRTPVEFPEQTTGLDPFAAQLFDMSSVLPPSMMQAASAVGYHVGPDSRGFLYNAEAHQVIQFLDIGTRAVTPTGLLELTAGPESMR